MLNFTDGLVHTYYPGIKDVSYSDTKKGINAWLTKGDTYFVTQDQPSSEFVIDVFNEIDFLGPYTYDINRLSCAAIESINNVHKVETSPKFLGWNITKYYYSAFFSAHCILRLCKNGLFTIDHNSINRINLLTRTRGYNTGSYTSGLYCIEVVSPNKYRFYKDPLYVNHEGLWRRFKTFFNDIVPGVYANLVQPEAQQIIDKIDELNRALCYTSDTISSGNWLSKVRNLVNYNQAYGLWFPYKDFKSENEVLFDCKNISKKDPLIIDIETWRGRDIVYFVKTCQLINAISFKILSDFEKLHPNNKSFVRKGIRAYYNLHLKDNVDDIVF